MQGYISYGAFLYNPLVYYAIHLAKAGTLSWWFLGMAMPICAGAINYAVFDARRSLVSRLLAVGMRTRQRPARASCPPYSRS